MSRVIIHACQQRKWYVDNYLVPSLTMQGIDNIDVRCDKDNRGNLESCMQIFQSMPDGNQGSWHIQDDVVICRNFRKITEQYDNGIVCGFTSTSTTKTGLVKPEHMWWSFPCIRIPDYIARECSEWFYAFAKNYAKYYEWVHMNKCDDNFFREFLRMNYPDIYVLNLIPNLVDHIDFLLGGSVVNQYRGEAQVRSQYFKDRDLVEKLEDELKGEKAE